MKPVRWHGLLGSSRGKALILPLPRRQRFLGRKPSDPQRGSARAQPPAVSDRPRPARRRPAAGAPQPPRRPRGPARRTAGARRLRAHSARPSPASAHAHTVCAWLASMHARSHHMCVWGTLVLHVLFTAQHSAPRALCQSQAQACMVPAAALPAQQQAAWERTLKLPVRHRGPASTGSAQSWQRRLLKTRWCYDRSAPQAVGQGCRGLARRCCSLDAQCGPLCCSQRRA